MKASIGIENLNGVVHLVEFETELDWKEQCKFLWKNFTNAEQVIDAVMFDKDIKEFHISEERHLYDVPVLTEHTFIFKEKYENTDNPWLHRHESKNSRGHGIWCVVNDCYVSDDCGWY